MTSDIQKLAAAVRHMGDKSGPVRPVIADASLQATRLSSSVPGGVPSASGLVAAFEAAGRELAQASRALDEFAKHADQFAERLVSGGGTGPGQESSGARLLQHPGDLSQKADPTH